MLYFASILLFIGLVLLYQSTRRRAATGLPGGRIIYADTNKWSAVEKPIYDPAVGLSGKPDYLIQQSDVVIPIEVKSSRISNAPYDSHIFQLAAYCRLVDHKYKKRPPYGIIHYPNRTFRIDYTPELEDDLLNILIEMRSQANRKEVHRSHASVPRCAKCGYNAICDQKLN